MTLKEIVKIINGQTNIEEDCKIKSIKTDTRKIENGDIFIALKGKKYDGNSFVEDALKRGALACITDKMLNNKCILVEDTYRVLFILGKYFRIKYNIPLIAITGSTGKTTTKELIVDILKSKYSVLYNKESKNNLIGVSDTLFNINNNHEIIVMELGSNHLGEIKELSDMCMPTLSVITNIGSSHLGYFKNKKNIFKEKKCITYGMKNIDLIVNGDDKYLKKMKAYKCGLKKRNNLRAYNITQYNNKIAFNIYIDKEYKIVFNNPGIHFVSDILLAIEACLKYNVPISKIIKVINKFKMPEKRMTILNIEDNIVLNDCYNSSYESAICGLNYIKNIDCHKVLIIGDILELGNYSKKIHKKLNNKIKKIDNKVVLTVGKYSKYIRGINFKSSNELIEYLKLNPIKDSYIYVKGSRRTNLDDVVKYLTKKGII